MIEKKKRKQNGQWNEEKLYETLNEIELVPRWINVSTPLGGLERPSVKRQGSAGCYDLEDVDDTCKAAIVRPDPFCMAVPWRSMVIPERGDPILQIPR